MSRCCRRRHETSADSRIPRRRFALGRFRGKDRSGPRAAPRTPARGFYLAVEPPRWSHPQGTRLRSCTQEVRVFGAVQSGAQQPIGRRLCQERTYKTPSGSGCLTLLPTRTARGACSESGGMAKTSQPLITAANAIEHASARMRISATSDLRRSVRRCHRGVLARVPSVSRPRRSRCGTTRHL